MPKLVDIGWNEHFQQQLDVLPLGGIDIIIGRVFRLEGDRLGILTEDGELTVRIPGKMKVQAHTASELPGVGDWVLVRPLELDNMIFKLLERKNHISRKVPGKEYKEQLVGANIDTIFIVMGLDKDYNLRRLERYLFMVAAARSQPVVILNKADIAGESLGKMLKDVQEIVEDVPVLAISALEQEGLEEVREHISQGRTISLVGSSGAGKSTLINALLGAKVQDTGDVRQNDSKGRHITSSRELFLLPNGGIMIDNPGIREIQLWGDIESLSEVFSDIEEISHNCKFNDCQHVSEPKCAVKMAVDDGTLQEKRYQNYLKMREELDFLQQKAEIGTEAIKKAKWKPIKKGADKYIEYKRQGR